MHKTVGKHIPVAYWRAALAEVNLLHPKVPADDKPINIGLVGRQWHVTAAEPDPGVWTARQFAASKLGGAVRADGRPVDSIPLVLVAARLSERVSGSVKPDVADINLGLSLLCIPCLLDRQGALYPDPERQAWIPRDLLEPHTSDATVGALDDADRFLSGLPGRAQTLADCLRTAAGLFFAVTGTGLPLLAEYENADAGAAEFALDGYRLVSAWHGLPYDPPIIARHLVKLYDQLIEKNPPAPLLERLRGFAERPARPPHGIAKAGAQYAETVGHIDQEHPLSPSQREAMVELAELPEGEILAVNGPPGTGKTTLLHGVVAQLWVKCAIRRAPCPLILVTSTNVKAVENVLESFAKIGEKTGHRRWIPYQGGFGLFLASAMRETKYPVCNGGNHPFEELENSAAIAAATAKYLGHASAFFNSPEPEDSVKTVVGKLHALLVRHHEQLKRILAIGLDIYQETGRDGQTGAQTLCLRRLASFQQAQAKAQAQIAAADLLIAQCRQAMAAVEAAYEAARADIVLAEQGWSAHLADAPLWLDLFAFLPFVRQRRNARDRHFLLGNRLTADLHDRDGDIDGHFQHLRKRAHDEKQSGVARHHADIRSAGEARASALQSREAADTGHRELAKLLQRWLGALGREHAGMADVAFDALNDALDTALRAPMFCLADWYWSGEWLQEVTLRLRGQIQDKKSPAKLEAKYRRFAKLAPCLVSNFHMAPSFFTGWAGQDLPMWNAIDLLVVDEAGQVSPDIGAAMFALAKRALVVGDTHQIEPVWNVGEGADRANLEKSGLAAGQGGRAAPLYEQLANDGYTAASGNLMRIASRACGVQKHPEMRGLMLTEHRRCVPELVRYCNALVYGGRLEPLRAALAPERRCLPAFGRRDIQGEDRKVGASRQNILEARAIVKWLADNRTGIENHYRDKDSGAPTPIWKLLGIVTPFSTQSRLIEREMRNSLPDLMKKGARLTVGTVHALQGAEREIVIFSPTYGQGHSGGMFFDRSPNMLNVAVSRARDSFLVIGNLALFDPGKKSKPSGLLGSFLFDDGCGAEI